MFLQHLTSGTAGVTNFGSSLQYPLADFEIDMNLDHGEVA